MQNNIVRILEGLEANQDALSSPDHPRWWELPAVPPTPIPVNVKYACDATLGAPSIANCEAALYEFIQPGDVILDPVSGPIIRVSGGSSDSHADTEAISDCQYFSGNCAIAVGANERHSTTWDMLRSVTETLIATCISSPRSGTLGGTAISQTIRARKRTSSLGRRQTGKISLHQRFLARD